MKNALTKKIILTAILMSITLLVALCSLFPLLSFVYNGYQYKISGYDCLGLASVSNDQYIEVVLPYITAGKVIAIAGLVATVVNLLMCFYHFNYENSRIAVLVVVSVALLLSLAYLILGAVLLGQANNGLTSGNTLSYLPFILICVLSLAYFSVAQLQYTDSDKNTDSKFQSTKNSTVHSQKYELLMELKTLLDNGLISQDEFDKEKQNILQIEKK